MKLQVIDRDSSMAIEYTSVNNDSKIEKKEVVYRR